MGELPRSGGQAASSRRGRARRRQRHAYAGRSLVGRRIVDGQGKTADPLGGAQIIAIAIHGGAGAMARKKMTAAASRRYKAALLRALEAGYAVLKTGAAM